MLISLTDDKVEKLQRAATDLLNKDSPLIREVAGLVGLIISYSNAFDYGLAHIKALENDKIQALKHSYGNFDYPMKISQNGKDDIVWWLNNVEASGKHVDVVLPDMILYADASHEGWGAHLGTQTTGGRWTNEESLLHINILELKAIYFALCSLCNDKAKHVKIMTDNTTALAYVKHMGGVRSLQCNEVAHDIWKWCENRDIWLTIAHIPGVENVVADYKSRHFSDNVEWKLNPKLFSTICNCFGFPDIDLFANRLNKQVDCYVSWNPDPGAIAIDAFTIEWTNRFFYAFPPFSCISRCISKILKEGATGVLVVPWWPTQAWWARLKNLGLRHIQFRPKKFNLLPIGKPKNVQFLNSCPLGVFRFSGNHC